jgi:drug/metabolite transporter (DMT)-like permease
MKKIITTVFATMGIIIANAQGDSDLDRSIFNACAVIFVMLAVMGFILSIIKKIIDYRLKNKIVDKGISENIASSILQTTPHEGINANIKWFAILAGIGAGLMLVNYTQPLGFHSVAIMAFSISLSFLGYYFFIRQSGKQ